MSARASADEGSNDARRAAASSDGDAVYAHRGFFIRPEAGVGYLSSSEPTSAGTIHVSGFAGVAGLALGGAVADNVILAAHVYDAVSVSPSVSLGGQSGTSNATLTTLGFGPELDVYVMPSNVFLSLTLAATTASVSVNGTSVSTKTGFGGRVALGKEWFVGNSWGLGAAAGISYASNADTNDATLTTWTFGLSFTATYNVFFEGESAPAQP